jgi:hypothetical protein
MTFIEAAAEVLRQAGKPLHYKEITELAITKNLLSHVGKTPEVTMSHRLTSAMKKDDKDVPIVKVKPGVFALREWQERKGDAGRDLRHRWGGPRRRRPGGQCVGDRGRAP